MSYSSDQPPEGGPWRYSANTRKGAAGPRVGRTRRAVFAFRAALIYADRRVSARFSAFRRVSARFGAFRRVSARFGAFRQATTKLSLDLAKGTDSEKGGEKEGMPVCDGGEGGREEAGDDALHVVDRIVYPTVPCCISYSTPLHPHIISYSTSLPLESISYSTPRTPYSISYSTSLPP